MKLLFLDIDGVLNSAEWIQNSGPKDQKIKQMTDKFGFFGDLEYYAADIDPLALIRLRCICNYFPDLKIVISSSWRILMPYHDIIRIFSYLGWENAPIIAQTPHSLRRQDVSEDGSIPVCRGHEIRYWLTWAGENLIQDKRTNQPVTWPYVILDDDSDFLEGQPLVQTSWQTGLQDVHLQEIITIFKK